MSQSEFVRCPRCGGTGLRSEAKGSEDAEGDDAAERVRELIAGRASDETGEDGHDPTYDPFEVEAQLAGWDHDDEHGGLTEGEEWLDLNSLAKCDLCRGRRRVLRHKAADHLLRERR